MNSKWKTIYPLFLMTFFTSSSVFFIVPELGPILLNHTTDSILPLSVSDNARQWCYGAALAFPQIFMLIGGPLWGALSDRFGRKVTLINALLGVALSMLISVIGLSFHSVSLLLVGQALLGMTDASDAIAQAAIVDVSHEKDRVSNISLMSMWGTLGLIVGPLFGGVFSDKSVLPWFNYQLPYYIAIFLVFLNVIGIFFMYKDKYKEKITEMSHQVNRVIDFSFIFQSSLLIKIAIIFFLMEASLALFYQYVPLVLLRSFHYSSHMIGIYFAFMAIIISVTYIVLIPYLIRYLSKINIIRVAFAFQVLVGSVLYVSNSEVVIWTCAVPMSVSVALVYCLAITIMSESSSEINQGKIMGASMTNVALSFLSAAIIGYVIAANINYVFILIIILPTIGFLFMSNFSRMNSEKIYKFSSAQSCIEKT